MQHPLLKNHIESEIYNIIKPKADECFASMQESYRKKGYNVALSEGKMEVELLPKKVSIVFNKTLSLTKDTTQSYESFVVVLNNNLYELMSIALSIANWEVRYGDAETTLYMTYYHNLKVEKKKQSEGTKIYILTDRNTENKFQFATRSVAWPPGYAARQVI